MTVFSRLLLLWAPAFTASRGLRVGLGQHILVGLRAAHFGMVAGDCGGAAGGSRAAHLIQNGPKMIPKLCQNDPKMIPK